MTAPFSEILDASCVVLELSARKKRAVIEELVATLKSAGKIGDARTLVDEILEREKLTSTAIGNGIAVPHKLSDEVPETTLAFGRSSEGIKFDAPDNIPVTLVFLLVGPTGAHTAHLRLLSRLARYLHDTEFRTALESEQRAEEIPKLFAEREAKQ
ncbi:MAG: PTS sugar transporter subunit IIA [Spirochaetaceae bacterium]